MGRFDIFANPGRNRSNIPYLVDVQSNVISGLATRIVVPLRPLSAFSSMDVSTRPVSYYRGQWRRSCHGHPTTWRHSVKRT
ncbi:hypothetical protein E4L98_22295 [Duganella callida]|uniref:Toxin CcdB n=1 Tax=Duganella callida TaxID=2561932 RepID=A0A4Y9S5Q5_9BURK|nr:hypothetical protein E4L98_22295 [Duganella callida]